MGTHATGTIEGKPWEERPYAEIDRGPKLTRANGADLYHGDIEGEATFEYLMMYRDDGSVSFIGLERVVGRLGELSGSFVLQLNGTVEGGATRPRRVTSTWSVVPGSGTEELRGLRGEGNLVYQDAQHSSITLDYTIA